MNYIPETGGHFAPEQLNAFVDGETTPFETDEIQQHLANCHACTLRVLAATRLKTATANAARHFDAPPEALARLSAQLQVEPHRETRRIYAFPSLRWTALAACFLLAISFIGWRQVRQTKTLSAELLDQHLAVLSSGAAPEVISSDRHTVKPWFQGRLPFSFNLPDALPADTTLKGGDLAYLEGQPAALLLFTIHKHEVSVFLTKRDNAVALIGPSGTQSGFLIRSATTRDLHITAVSDVNAFDLDLLVKSLAQAQSPH